MEIKLPGTNTYLDFDRTISEWKLEIINRSPDPLSFTIAPIPNPEDEETVPLSTVSYTLITLKEYHPFEAQDMVQRVLITDDSLLPEYNGIIRRDGKLVGIRLGSLAYDFPIGQNQVALTGSMGADQMLECTIVMDEDHPTNPFKHLYHPDHQQGRKISRQIQFTFDSNQESSNPDDAKFSLIGNYSESISGLHKIPLKISGPFNIHRISEVGKLNE